MKNRVDYFPHDTNTSVEPEVVALIKNYGIEGYGLYFIIMELLGRSESFRLRIKTELEIECLSAACGLQSEKFSSIVAYMKRLDLVQVDDGELRCKRFEKSIEFLLEIREKAKERAAKNRAAKKEVRQTFTEFDKKDESSTNSEEVRQKDAQSKVKESKVKESKVNFLGGGGKHAHEKNQNQDQPTTDQKKYINSAIYEEIQEELQKTDTKDEEEYKRKKVAPKKEKEFTQQDEQDGGKMEIEGISEGIERDDSRNAKIDPFTQKIETEIYINSLFSHDFAPHWQNWIEHLENRGISTPTQVQIAQQAEHIKNANEQNVSIQKLEKMLIMEIASTIQNQKKTSKNLVGLNPFFHLKKITDNERTNQNRKYKSKYNS